MDFLLRRVCSSSLVCNPYHRSSLVVLVGRLQAWRSFCFRTILPLCRLLVGCPRKDVGILRAFASTHVDTSEETQEFIVYMGDKDMLAFLLGRLVDTDPGESLDSNFGSRGSSDEETEQPSSDIHCLKI